MSESLKIKKGLDIRIKGKAKEVLTDNLTFKKFSVDPSDFKNINPKLLIKAGEKVKAGTPLFHDKIREELIFVSPISGTLAEIERGEKRKILSLKIEADGLNESIDLGKPDLKSISREELSQLLLKSGLWTFIKQRPYSTIADYRNTPKAIFVSCFNTAPLAPTIDFLLKNDRKSFEMGIEVLKKLTDGKIHLNIDGSKSVHEVFQQLKGVEINKFEGKHPAGNVGVQIHHIDPINKGDVVWTVQPEDLVIIGRFIDKGIVDMSRYVALTGSEILNPQYYKTIVGAEIDPMLKDNLTQEKHRFISGNVLSGKQIPNNGYLGFYDTQITVIPEGDHSEFLGWMMPGINKFSFSNTFFSKIFPKKEYSLDSNFNGGERAYVITGEFEKVLPMDIYPMQLIKAVLAEDIDMMEKLGIYEVAEEDFALCEYICTSKTEIQDIIKNGIDLMIKEMS